MINQKEVPSIAATRARGFGRRLSGSKLTTGRPAAFIALAWHQRAGFVPSHGRSRRQPAALRVRVLVATDRLTRGAVDMREPVQSSSSEDAVHGRRRDTEPRRELNRAFPQSNSQADAPLRDSL